MNMDLDAATKEAPTLTLDPFAEAKAEIVEKKPEEGVESVEAETGRRKVNMNDAVAKELAALIQGQSLTISQINDKMQEKYPGLPKRQV